MITGQHGAMPSSAGRARVMNIANGPSGLLPALPLRRATTRRFLYSPSNMTPSSSKHPPGWKLWHHSQGINFQPPLYPILDVARLTTEASAAREIETDSNGAALRVETKPVREESFITRSLVRKTVVAEESTVGMDRTTLKTSSITGARQRLSGLRLGGTKRRGAEAKAQEGQNDSNSPEPAAEPKASEEHADSCRTPFTPLDYKMSDDTFQAAKTAPEGSAESFWSYSFYRGPGEEGKVKVHYCRSAHAAERALQHLLEEKHLGLDIEWVIEANKYSGARRNVSLVQLASQSRVVLLHLALYPAKDELATPMLQKLLGDPEVTKLGVWIKGDCTRLKNFLGIEARSIFELSHLFKQVKYSASGQPKLINKKLVSLADQVLETTGLPLKKERNVRTSDWSQPLDMEQIGYAASDAYAAVQLFAMLNHKREQLNPAPALPFHAELDKPIPLPPDVDSSSSEEADTEEQVAAEAELEEEDSGGSLAELQREVIQLLREARKHVADVDGEGSEGQLDTSSISTKVAKRKAAAVRQPRPPPKNSSPPKDPRIIAAEAWLAEYKEGLDGQLTATPSILKAYHVWHANVDLDANDVAQLLRDPPLQASSVASYILTSLKSEQLPFDKVRLETGVLSYLPKNIMKRRSETISKLMSDAAVPSKD